MRVARGAKDEARIETTKHCVYPGDERSEEQETTGSYLGDVMYGSIGIGRWCPVNVPSKLVASLLAPPYLDTLVTHFARH